jgi:hypothetical protein
MLGFTFPESIASVLILKNSYREEAMKKFLLAIGMCALFTNGAFAAEVVRGDLKLSELPRELQSNSGIEKMGQNPYAGGFNEMLPYVFHSPNQEDAGSCLYMSATGIVEWWMAKLYPKAPRRMDGSIDLSERYAMNLHGMMSKELPNWRTDIIQIFNQGNRALKNSAYRYTKDWYKDSERGYVQTDADQSGAQFGTPFNWIADKEQINQAETGDWVELPTFKRRVLFEDPAKNQWNIGVTPLNIAEQVKEALRKYKAPVHVIYNHYAYWHAVYIAGYNDNARTDCEFSEGFVPYMSDTVDKYRRNAEAATNPKEREKYLRYASKFQIQVDKAKKRWKEIGGCSGKGVFYVRDSLSSEESEGEYDYNLNENGEERFYSKSIVFRSYEWLQMFANNVTQVTIVPAK